MTIAAIDLAAVIFIACLFTPLIIYLMAVFMDFHLSRRVREFLRCMLSIKIAVIGLSIAGICWLSYRAIDRYHDERKVKIQFYDEIVD